MDTRPPWVDIFDDEAPPNLLTAGAVSSVLNKESFTPCLEASPRPAIKISTKKKVKVRDWTPKPQEKV